MWLHNLWFLNISVEFFVTEPIPIFFLILYSLFIWLCWSPLWTRVFQGTHTVSSCGSETQCLRSIGLAAPRHTGRQLPNEDQTCGPAPQGGFLTTEPPGKSQVHLVVILGLTQTDLNRKRASDTDSQFLILPSDYKKLMFVFFY